LGKGATIDAAALSREPAMSCPYAKSCALYPLFTNDTLLSYWKSSYCEADHSRCARFRLSTSGKPVPVNMLPSGNLMKMGGSKP
jgi:hypothetical protein